MRGTVLTASQSALLQPSVKSCSLLGGSSILGPWLTRCTHSGESLQTLERRVYIRFYCELCAALTEPKVDGLV